MHDAFRVVDEIGVVGQGGFRVRLYHGHQPLVLRHFLLAEVLLQDNQVTAHLRARVVREQVVGQAYRGYQIGLTEQLVTHGGLGAIQYPLRGDERHDTAVTHGIQSFEKEIVVDGFLGGASAERVAPLKLRVEHGNVTERNVGHRQVEIIVERSFDFLKTAGAHFLVGIEMPQDCTRVDGKFTIQASLGNTLQVSFIGYKTQTTKVANKHITIVLQEDMEMLDEVVVIGYGTVKKSDLTGSVSSISQKNIKDQPMTRLDQALSGRIPGVVVITNSGAPEQSTQIRIRGANSIYGGNSPLYIVDGVPNTDLFNNLAPNDIQSIEVLKDASATAIYGSRGANGVILVTTKRGAEGKTNIHLETEQSISTIAKKLDLLSASEYAEFYNEYRREKGANQDFFSPDEITQWKKNGGTDWQDLMFRTAHTQNYKLSISGGIPKLQYLVSMNMMDIEGILKESKSQKFSLRSNFEYELF